jgi:hypothetical protein
MRAGDLALGELVQPERKPFRKPAVVDEDDRRPVGLDELEDLGVDRRPDRALRAFTMDAFRVGAGLAHVLDGHDDLEVELLRHARVDQLDLACAGDEASDLLHGTLRRRETDALEGLVHETLEPLDRQRQVRPALRARDRMHLVEDERLDPP